MKIRRIFHRSSRGVTPVIATVLLIGLVVVAGIGIAILMFGTIATPDPLKVEILSISEFKTTELTNKDFLVDRFSVTLQNVERTTVRIESDAFQLLDRNKNEIPGWFMNLDLEEITLPALSIRVIPLACDLDDDSSELAPLNDTIYIEVTVYPEESTNPRSAKSFRSNLLIVGNTYGPVYLEFLPPGPFLGDDGLNLSFNVENYGSTKLDVYLEFTSSSPDKIFFNINGDNDSTYSFSLTKFSNNTLSNEVFTIKPFPSKVSSGEPFLILIYLWDQENLNLLAIAFHLLEYQ